MSNEGATCPHPMWVVSEPQKIAGYRSLSEFEVYTINDCKNVAIQVGILCDKVAGMNGNDLRWSSIARTELQQGFMALIRSIAKPETF